MMNGLKRQVLNQIREPICVWRRSGLQIYYQVCDQVRDQIVPVDGVRHQILEVLWIR